MRGVVVLPCSETWIVMDLLDRGNLAMALRHKTLFLNDDGSLNMVGYRQRLTGVLYRLNSVI